MNYQIGLESYSTIEGISKDELSLLELEIDSQPESMDYSQNVLLEKLLNTFEERLKYAKVLF